MPATDAPVWLIHNARLITPDRELPHGWILVREGRISAIGEGTPPDHDRMSAIDADGAYVGPGFIDTHIHGGGGYEVMDSDFETLPNLARVLVSHGVTAFMPTTYTAEHDVTMRALENAAHHVGSVDGGATILRAHMEGPYLNPDRKGAHREELIRLPTQVEVEAYLGTGVVGQMVVAPELPENGWLMDRLVREGITIAAGHSDASYEQMVAAVGRGASVVTHVYNGMGGFHHRDPGTVGGALTLDGLRCEIIADKAHVSPAAIELAWRAKGSKGLILITDANMSAGMEEGTYVRHGREVTVANGVARLPDGTIAGSASFLDRDFRNLLEITHAPVHQAWRTASINPARSIGIADRKGSLEVGKDADIILIDDQGTVTKTFVEGRLVHR